jgi:hypothetical protein
VRDGTAPSLSRGVLHGSGIDSVDSCPANLCTSRPVARQVAEMRKEGVGLIRNQCTWACDPPTADENDVGEECRFPVNVELAWYGS